MSKKNRRVASKMSQRRATAPAAGQTVGAQPSGTPKKPRASVAFVERPFEGLAAEPDLVAMREILPLATFPVTTSEEYGSANVVLTTMLPSMAGALRRADGVLLVATQTVMSSGDASRDIAARIIDGLDLRNGEALHVSDLPEPGPRLQDVVASFGELELHEIPTFWMTEEDAAKPENKQALEDSRSQLIPTKAVDGVNGAFWCRMSREFVRWVRSEPRDAVLDGLARLRASDDFSFDGSRFVGAFRALGLIIPVWELPRGAEADELTEPMAQFAPKLDAAISSSTPLTPEEKRARAGIVSRQVTLR